MITVEELIVQSLYHRLVVVRVKRTDDTGQEVVTVRAQPLADTTPESESMPGDTEPCTQLPRQTTGLGFLVMGALSPKVKKAFSSYESTTPGGSPVALPPPRDADKQATDGAVVQVKTADGNMVEFSREVKTVIDTGEIRLVRTVLKSTETQTELCETELPPYWHFSLDASTETSIFATPPSTSPIKCPGRALDSADGADRILEDASQKTLEVASRPKQESLDVPGAAQQEVEGHVIDLSECDEFSVMHFQDLREPSTKKLVVVQTPETSAVVQRDVTGNFVLQEALASRACSSLSGEYIQGMIDHIQLGDSTEVGREEMIKQIREVTEGTGDLTTRLNEMDDQTQIVTGADGVNQLTNASPDSTKENNEPLPVKKDPSVRKKKSAKRRKGVAKTVSNDSHVSNQNEDSTAPSDAGTDAGSGQTKVRKKKKTGQSPKKSSRRKAKRKADKDNVPTENNVPDEQTEHIETKQVVEVCDESKLVSDASCSTEVAKPMPDEQVDVNKDEPSLESTTKPSGFALVSEHIKSVIDEGSKLFASAFSPVAKEQRTLCSPPQDDFVEIDSGVWDVLPGRDTLTSTCSSTRESTPVGPHMSHGQVSQFAISGREDRGKRGDPFVLTHKLFSFQEGTESATARALVDESSHTLENGCHLSPVLNERDSTSPNFLLSDVASDGIFTDDVIKSSYVSTSPLPCVQNIDQIKLPAPSSEQVNGICSDNRHTASYESTNHNDPISHAESAHTSRSNSDVGVSAACMGSGVDFEERLVKTIYQNSSALPKSHVGFESGFPTAPLTCHNSLHGTGDQQIPRYDSSEAHGPVAHHTTKPQSKSAITLDLVKDKKLLLDLLMASNENDKLEILEKGHVRSANIDIPGKSSGAVGEFRVTLDNVPVSVQEMLNAPHSMSHSFTALPVPTTTVQSTPDATPEKKLEQESAASRLSQSLPPSPNFKRHYRHAHCKEPGPITEVADNDVGSLLSQGSDDWSLSSRDMSPDGLMWDSSDESFISEMMKMEAPDFQRFTDWMSELPDRLHSVSLTRLVIPGSHIALAVDKDMRSDMNFSKCNYEMVDFLRKLPDLAVFNNFRSVMKRIWRAWMPKQTLGVGQQLEAGVRYLDIRITKFRSAFYGEHGLYTKQFSKYLKEIKQFTDLHPLEIVILHFQALDQLEKGDKRRLVTYLFQVFGARLAKVRPLNKVTLKDLWATRKQIIAIFPQAEMAQLRNHIFSGLIWSDQIFHSTVSTVPSVDQLIIYLDETYKEISDDVGGQMFHVTKAVLSPDMTMVFGDFPYKTLKEMTVQETNQMLTKWLNGKDNLNIVAMDFVGLGDCVAKVIRLNGIVRVMTRV